MLERIEDLHNQLDTATLHNGNMSYYWWQIWQASNYVAYPFEGGAMAQPTWLLDDFATLDLLQELASLTIEYEQLAEKLAKQAQGKA